MHARRDLNLFVHKALFVWLKAMPQKKDPTPKSTSGAPRTREGAPGAVSLRRCNSVSEGRRLLDEGRSIRRASSTEVLSSSPAGHRPSGSRLASKTSTISEKPKGAAKDAVDAGQASEGATTATETGSSPSSTTGTLTSRRKKPPEPQNAEDPHGDVSDSEAGDARASLQVDSELINAAYKEIEKCMECFNVLGLRFQRSSMLSLKQTGARWVNGGCVSQSMEESDSARGRRGASRTRAHAPFRPFLRKDRNIAKRNAVPVKSTYTKLHKVSTEEDLLAVLSIQVCV